MAEFQITISRTRKETLTVSVFETTEDAAVARVDKILSAMVNGESKLLSSSDWELDDEEFDTTELVEI